MWESIPRRDSSHWSGGKERLTVGVSCHICFQSPWSTFHQAVLKLADLYLQHQIMPNYVKLGSEAFI